MTATCISLVAFLKTEVFGGNGQDTIDAWKSLTDKDKSDLREYAVAEGFNITPLSA